MGLHALVLFGLARLRVIGRDWSVVGGCSVMTLSCSCRQQKSVTRARTKAVRERTPA